MQNYLAWMIATDPKIEKRDLELAEVMPIAPTKPPTEVSIDHRYRGD